jgi:hypothetical protein
VQSDHKNLKYFTTTKQLTGRQIRWHEELAKFKFRIKYIKGKRNTAADALSRQPDYTIGVKQPESNLLQQNKDGTIQCNQEAVLAATIVVEDKDFLERLQKAMEKDEYLKQWKNNTTNLVEEQGLILWNGSIMVPQDIVTEVIYLHHNLPTEGHQGIGRTIEKIQQNYFFPKIEQAVRTYINKYNECNRNKPLNHQLYGKMQINETPKKAWNHITVDFIQGLPPSKDPITGITYTDTMITVCKLTKYTILRPIQKEITTQKLALLMLQEIFIWTRLPRYITSDRDKLFTSKYWETITEACGIEQKLSTANHQQTDGQSERMI